MAGFIQPVAGPVSSSFGVDRGDHAHVGVDIAAPCGTPVVAAAAGRVSAAKWSDTAGNMIILDHGGGQDSRYFHLSRFAVAQGSYVQAGAVIGYVGSTGNSTGCHLHWEVRQNGQAINPLLASPVAASGAQLGPLASVLQAEAFEFGGVDGRTLALGFGFLLLIVIVARR